ncbi:MAG: hypothetical protein AVDCRST_MAG72-2332 [uncultured Nocardioidaceae bacterium]|uniref:Integral membrane protein n=1 Tax=uncultured Nocardioidaceae bacterium TaxID=253824 RepID=A0A6J4MQW2_9ACTN|nr:MAG: hypothetical protein AVDCRST_MAG72-2332 [uncultured Nocardioidaceae bacterium]
MTTLRRDVGAWLRDHRRDAVFWTGVVQLAKTVLAATLAWIVAADLLDLAQPFLAPWAALLVVHATVYRTFFRGVKQVGATVVGVVLAWATGNLLGLDPLAMAVMLLVGLAVGRLRPVHEEGTTVATTAVIVLATGFSGEDTILVMRLIDTAIGVGVGLVVNLLVWPPLLDRAAARAIDRIDDGVGQLLCDMAAGLRGAPDQKLVLRWIEASENLDHDIDHAWALVRQARESGRLNPRRSAGDVRRAGEFGDVLFRLEQSVADVRSMARTIDHSVVNVLQWHPRFREEWLVLVEETGLAIQAADSVRLGRARSRLRHLADDLSTEDLAALHWPEYGALIANLRNIITSMDVVADSNPVTPRLVRHPDRAGGLSSR